jgi:hypothetical protein
VIAGTASRTRPIGFNPWVAFDVIIGGGRPLDGAGAPPSRADALLEAETRLEAGCVFARPDEGEEGQESVRRTLCHPGRALRPGG